MNYTFRQVLLSNLPVNWGALEVFKALIPIQGATQPRWLELMKEVTAVRPSLLRRPRSHVIASAQPKVLRRMPTPRPAPVWRRDHEPLLAKLARTRVAGRHPARILERADGVALREKEESDASQSEDELPGEVRRHIFGAKRFARFWRQGADGSGSASSVLEENSVSGAARKHYCAAYDAFLDFCQRESKEIKTSRHMDEALVSFFHELFFAGWEISKGEKVIAAVAYLLPRYSAKGDLTLPRAKKAMQGWRRLVPQRSQIPYQLRYLGNCSFACAAWRARHGRFLLIVFRDIFSSRFNDVLEERGGPETSCGYKPPLGFATAPILFW